MFNNQNLGLNTVYISLLRSGFYMYRCYEMGLFLSVPGGDFLIHINSTPNLKKKENRVCTN